MFCAKYYFAITHRLRVFNSHRVPQCVEQRQRWCPPAYRHCLWLTTGEKPMLTNLTYGTTIKSLLGIPLFAFLSSQRSRWTDKRPDLDTVAPSPSAGKCNLYGRPTHQILIGERSFEVFSCSAISRMIQYMQKCWNPSHVSSHQLSRLSF